MVESDAALLDVEPTRIHRPVTGFNGSTDGFARTLVRVGEVALIGAPQDRFEPLPTSGSIYAYRKAGSDWAFTGVVSPQGFDVCDFSQFLVGGGEYAFTAARTGSCSHPDGAMLFRIDLDGAGAPRIGDATAVGSDGANTTIGDIDADGSSVILAVSANASSLVDAVFVYGTDLQQPPLRLDPASDAIYFAGQVAISGDWLAVSCLYVEAQDGIQPGCVQFFHRSGTSAPWLAAGVVDAPQGVDSATFGWELRLSGERLFVGASAWRGGEPYLPGKVAEYAFDGMAWQHRSTIAPENGLPNDQFGRRILFDAGELFVFAPDRGVSSDRREGALYRYCAGPDAWQPCGFLEAAPGDEDWPRPEDVAVFDDEILLAQPHLYNIEDGSQGSVGRVSRSETLTSIDTFHPGDGGSEQDAFGHSVATDGDLLAVGAPGYQGYGAVFLYRRAGATWMLEHALLGDSLGSNCPSFGSTVAVRGGGVAVTNGCADEADDAHGHILFYRHGETGWQESSRYRVPRTLENAGFGRTLQLTGGGVVYGAPEANIDGVHNAGAVHVLRYFVLGFLDTLVRAPSPRENGGFGKEIAVRPAARPLHFDSDVQIAVAGSGNVQNSVEMFSIKPSGFDEAIHIATLATSEPDASAEFGAALAMDAIAILVGAPKARCPVGADARAGALYRYERVDGVWALVQRICDNDVQMFAGDVALTERNTIVSSLGEFGVRLHEFDRNGDAWKEAATRDDARIGAYGSPLAMTDSSLVIGVPLAQHPVTFTQPGAVDVFDTGLLFDDQFEAIDADLR